MFMKPTKFEIVLCMLCIILAKLLIMIVIISIYSIKYAILAVFSFPKFSLIVFKMLCTIIIIKIVPSIVILVTTSFPSIFKIALYISLLFTFPVRLFVISSCMLISGNASFVYFSPSCMNVPRFNASNWSFIIVSVP